MKSFNLCKFIQLYGSKNILNCRQSATGQIFLIVVLLILICSSYFGIALLGYYGSLYDPLLNVTLCKAQLIVNEYLLKNITNPSFMDDNPHCCYNRSKYYEAICFGSGLINLIILMIIIYMASIPIFIISYLIINCFKLCYQAYNEQKAIYEISLNEMIIHKD